MYRSWLDDWDERKALQGDQLKANAPFALEAYRCFQCGSNADSVEDFIGLAESAVTDPAFYDQEGQCDWNFNKQKGWISFPSGILSDIDENNRVCAKITEANPSRKALIVFHPWNAKKRNRIISKFFSQRGITVVEIVMPYHMERQRPGSTHADYMLSPNLGRTIQAVRQAVWDGQRLIRCLKISGYDNISVLGISLGSWVAGLVAAHDPAVSKASLLLSAGSLADMVWTGRATRCIRESLEHNISLVDLRKAWSPLNLENYARGLTRADLDLQLVLAMRDRVVLPELSAKFVNRLKQAGGSPDVLELNCGHYSLALPPYSMLAGLRLNRFLNRA